MAVKGIAQGEIGPGPEQKYKQAPNWALSNILSVAVTKHGNNSGLELATTSLCEGRARNLRTAHFINESRKKRRRTAHFINEGRNNQRTAHFINEGRNNQRTAHFINEGRNNQRTAHFINESRKKRRRTAHFINEGRNNQRTAHFINEAETISVQLISSTKAETFDCGKLPRLYKSLISYPRRSSLHFPPAAPLQPPEQTNLPTNPPPSNPGLLYHTPAVFLVNKYNENFPLPHRSSHQDQVFGDNLTPSQIKVAVNGTSGPVFNLWKTMVSI
ncbi:hypothetical protein J6590_031842 [Homalodisca vitripennis]|nr:hypothetical protein J6590_031842 [Homalodisca vitripennis]